MMIKRGSSPGRIDCERCGEMFYEYGKNGCGKMTNIVYMREV